MSPQPFPHLLPAEALLWARFLARYGSQWDAFEYDLRLGQGVPTDPNLLPVYQEMATRLSLKRVDAVGWKDGQATLFEVNPSGSRTAIGAIRLYEWLFRDQFPQSPPPHLAVVLGRCDHDCLRYYQGTGVQVFIIGEPVLV